VVALVGIDEDAAVRECRRELQRVLHRYERIARPVPQMHFRPDVARLEAPAGGIRQKVVDQPADARAGRVEEARGRSRALTGAVETIALRRRRVRRDHARDQLRMRGRERQHGVAQTPADPRSAGQRCQRNTDAPLQSRRAMRRAERRERAAQRDPPHPLRQPLGERQRVGSAGRHADDRKAAEPQGVSELFNVVGKVEQRPARLRV